MRAFLFTDIEASTRLWEEHPTEMAEALARHDAILEEKVATAGGQILKRTGDGVVALFPTAAQAVAGALNAQLSLTAEAWAVTGPLRSRMGIHAGETQDRGGDYFGPVMNRAARIMAAAHGGQILLSAVAADLGSGALENGVDLLDLGSHRLKDLTRPEHLYQLTHPRLEAGFPAPNTLDATPHNLPLQATEFLGRTQELAAAQLMLESPTTRLLTLTGPGGAGKTRLGLQLAAEQTQRFRDGVFFVDLSAETEPNNAFEAVVRALDLPVAEASDPLELLKTRLRDQKMLLVLDNFEQVTAAAAGLAELLAAAPDLKILVTSRETLRIRAEQVYPVPPLGLPNPKAAPEAIADSESVQLFLDRARAIRPDITVDESNAQAIAEICLILDGLPLALELAAARLNVFSPSDLLERLRRQLSILGAGGRDLPDRQRTLWGAIGWSYELLDAAEKRLFELMSVFSTVRLEPLEAVAASAGAEGAVIDTVASLVDKSLLRRVEDGEFSMLLMIKEYAEERLADDPDRDRRARESHAQYFSRYAAVLKERLRSAERAKALDELELEIGNLRSAWRFWVNRDEVERIFDLLDGLWELHEAKGWYQAAIETARDALDVLARTGPSPELEAEELAIRTGLARALMAVRGFDPEVEQAFQKALEMSDAASTPAQQFPLLRALATYYLGIVNVPKAMEMGNRLLELGRAEGNKMIEVEGHVVLGTTISFARPEAALAHLEQAIAEHKPDLQRPRRFRLGPDTGVVARVSAGLVQWEFGALEKAVKHLAAALQLARDLEHPYSLAFALHHNAFLAIARSRFEECLTHARELRQVAEENDYTLWRSVSDVLEGVGLTATGDGERGVAMTEAGIGLYQGLTTPPVFWPLLLSLLASAHAMAGNPERALQVIEETLALDPDEGQGQPVFLAMRGDFLRMLPNPDLAEVERAYQAAVKVSLQVGLHLNALRAQTRLVTLNRELGRTPDGSEKLREIYDSFDEGLDEADLVAAREVLGLEDSPTSSTVTG
jgi:predicted ATPase/class 3 adenylate cyclase